ncbi:MAG: hypothetical protein WDZ35_05530 [Crocinitomicaceae bacterium]
MKHSSLNHLLIILISCLTFVTTNTLAVEKEKNPLSTSFEEIELKAMKDFSVEKKNGKMHIGFNYVIKNPNKMAVVIKPSSLFLTIADQGCGWVRIEEKIRIKRKSEGEYRFMMVGNTENFVKSAFSSVWGLLTGNGIDFNIKGKLNAGIFLFKKKWKMDYTYKMTNEEFMSFF